VSEDEDRKRDDRSLFDLYERISTGGVWIERSKAPPNRVHERARATADERASRKRPSRDRRRKESTRHPRLLMDDPDSPRRACHKTRRACHISATNRVRD
jgi:hypothetical protein